MVSDLCLPRHVSDLIPLIRAEYLEMPGMRLTLAQASRLWNTERDIVALALQDLIDAGFLFRTEGLYARPNTGRRCA